jgi:hypothetical protein
MTARGSVRRPLWPVGEITGVIGVILGPLAITRWGVSQRAPAAPSMRQAQPYVKAPPSHFATTGVIAQTLTSSSGTAGKVQTVGQTFP